MRGRPRSIARTGVIVIAIDKMNVGTEPAAWRDSIESK
jgi:hypothetical protein